MKRILKTSVVALLAFSSATDHSCTAFQIPSVALLHSRTVPSTTVTSHNTRISNKQINHNTNNHSPSYPRTSSTSFTKLYDLSSWRDIFFDEDSTPSIVTERMQDQMKSNEPPYLEGPARELCVLPFPLTDVLLQGETKELCLYEDRFHQLFEKCQNDHEGVLAMGLLAPPDGILQIMSLCEVESFRKMESPTAFGTDYSILVTIRAVGRAALIHIDEDDNLPFMVGWCAECFDDTPSPEASSSSSSSSVSFSAAKSFTSESVDAILSSSRNENTGQVANNIANKLEYMLESISKLEERVSLSGDGMGGSSSRSSSASTGTLEDLFNFEDDDDENDEDFNSGTQISEASMRRRLLEAELDNMDDDDEDEDDEDDYEDEVPDNRMSRFKLAYKNAKATDMQGYRIAATSFSTDSSTLSNASPLMDEDDTGIQRSMQELTALSWAYFCTEAEDDMTDIIQYRLRALDCMDLRERLTLALVMMMEQRSKLKATLSGSSMEDDEES